MQEEEHITDQSLSEEVDVASTDGEAAGSAEAQDVITLQDVEQTLGKKFPDKASALKSWKDTYSYVGKKNPQPATSQPAVDTSNFVSKEQYEEDMWFASHQDLSEHRTLIRALKKETGKSYSELMEHPEFKPLIEAKKAQAEAANSKSVIHGNSRVGNTADYQTDLEQAQSTGNWSEFLSKHKGVAIPE